MSTEISRKTFPIKEDLYSVGILPIDAKYTLPHLEITANEKRSKIRGKDDRDKREREYIERTITLKASETKSYSGLVNQLPHHGWRKEP